MNPIQGTHFEGQQKCLFVMGFVWTNIPTKVSTLLCWSVVTTSAAPSLTWCNNNNKKDMLDQIVVEVCNDEDERDEDDKWHGFGLPFPVELISCLNGTCKIKQACRHKQNKVQKVLWKTSTWNTWWQADLDFRKSLIKARKRTYTFGAPFWLAQVF